MLYDVFGPAWNELDRLQDDFTRLISRSRRTTDTYSALNVWANDDSIAVTAEVPGVKPEDLTVSLVGDTLTLSGKRQSQAPDGEVTWLRRERAEFEFTRTIQLPYAVDPNRTEARQKNGVLTIAFRRAESDRPRRIAIQPA